MKAARPGHGGLAHTPGAAYHGDWQCGQLDLPLERNHLYRHAAWNLLVQVRQLRRGSERLAGWITL